MWENRKNKLLVSALFAAFSVAFAAPVFAQVQNSYEVPWWNQDYSYRVPLKLDSSLSNRTGELVRVSGGHLANMLSSQVVLENVSESSIRVVHWNGSANNLIPSQVNDWKAAGEKGFIVTPTKGVPSSGPPQDNNLTKSFNLSLPRAAVYSIYINTSTGGTFSFNVTKNDSLVWKTPQNVNVPQGEDSFLAKIPVPLDAAVHEFTIKPIKNLSYSIKSNVSSVNIVIDYLDENTYLDAAEVDEKGDFYSEGDEIVFVKDFAANDSQSVYFVYFNASETAAQNTPSYVRKTYYFTAPLSGLNDSSVSEICAGADAVDYRGLGDLFVSSVKFFVKNSSGDAVIKFSVRDDYDSPVFSSQTLTLPNATDYWQEVYPMEEVENQPDYDAFVCVEIVSGSVELGYGGTQSSGRTWEFFDGNLSWGSRAEDLAFVFEFYSNGRHAVLEDNDSLFVHHGYSSLVNFSKGGVVEKLWSQGYETSGYNDSIQLAGGSGVSAFSFSNGTQVFTQIGSSNTTVVRIVEGPVATNVKILYTYGSGQGFMKASVVYTFYSDKLDAQAAVVSFQGIESGTVFRQNTSMRSMLNSLNSSIAFNVTARLNGSVKTAFLDGAADVLQNASMKWGNTTDLALSVFDDAKKTYLSIVKSNSTNKNHTLSIRGFSYGTEFLDRLLYYNETSRQVGFGYLRDRIRVPRTVNQEIVLHDYSEFSGSRYSEADRDAIIHPVLDSLETEDLQGMSIHFDQNQPESFLFGHVHDFNLSISIGGPMAAFLRNANLSLSVPSDSGITDEETTLERNYSASHDSSSNASVIVFLYRDVLAKGYFNKVLLRILWDASDSQNLEKPFTANPANVSGKIGFSGDYVNAVCSPYPVTNRVLLNNLSVNYSGVFGFSGRLGDFLSTGLPLQGIECVVIGTNDTLFNLSDLSFTRDGQRLWMEAYLGKTPLGNHSEFSYSAGMNYSTDSLSTQLQIGNLSRNETFDSGLLRFYESSFGETTFLVVNVSGVDQAVNKSFNLSHSYSTNVVLPPLSQGVSPGFVRIRLLDELSGSQPNLSSPLWTDGVDSGLPNSESVLYSGWEETSSNYLFRKALVKAGGERRLGLLSYPDRDTGPNVSIVSFDFESLPYSCYFESFIAIADIDELNQNASLDSCVGSPKDGVDFVVEVIGEDFSATVLDESEYNFNNWTRVVGSLAAFGGQDVRVRLLTDSIGGTACDYAVWGEPAIVCNGTRYPGENMQVVVSLPGSEKLTWPMQDFSANLSKETYLDWAVTESCASNSCGKESSSRLYPGGEKSFTWYVSSPQGVFDIKTSLSALFAGDPDAYSSSERNTTVVFRNPLTVSTSAYGALGEKQAYLNYVTPINLSISKNVYLSAPLLNLSAELASGGFFEVLEEERPHSSRPLSEFDVWRTPVKIRGPYPRHDYQWVHFGFAFPCNGTVDFRNATVYYCEASGNLSFSSNVSSAAFNTSFSSYSNFSCLVHSTQPGKIVLDLNASTNFSVYMGDENISGQNASFSGITAYLWYGNRTPDDRIFSKTYLSSDMIYYNGSVNYPSGDVELKANESLNLSTLISGVYDLYIYYSMGPGVLNVSVSGENNGSFELPMREEKGFSKIGKHELYGNETFEFLLSNNSTIMVSAVLFRERISPGAVAEETLTYFNSSSVLGEAYPLNSSNATRAFFATYLDYSDFRQSNGSFALHAANVPVNYESTDPSKPACNLSITLYENIESLNDSQSENWLWYDAGNGSSSQCLSPPETSGKKWYEEDYSVFLAGWNGTAYGENSSEANFPFEIASQNDYSDVFFVKTIVLEDEPYRVGYLFNVTSGYMIYVNGVLADSWADLDSDGLAEENEFGVNETRVCEATQSAETLVSKQYRDITRYFRRGENKIAAWVSGSTGPAKSDFVFNVSLYSGRIEQSRKKSFASDQSLRFNFSSASLSDRVSEGSDVVAVLGFELPSSNYSTSCSPNLSSTTRMLRARNDLGEWDDFLAPSSYGVWLDNKTNWFKANLSDDKRGGEIKQGVLPRFYAKTKKQSGAFNVSLIVEAEAGSMLTLRYLVFNGSVNATRWKNKTIVTQAVNNIWVEISPFEENLTYLTSDLNYSGQGYVVGEFAVGVWNNTVSNSSNFSVSMIEIWGSSTQNDYLAFGTGGNYTSGRLGGNLGVLFSTGDENRSTILSVLPLKTGRVSYNTTVSAYNWNTLWNASFEEKSSDLWISDEPFTLELDYPLEASTGANYTVNLTVKTSPYLREKINLSNVSLHLSNLIDVDSTASFSLGVFGKNQTVVKTFNLSTVSAGKAVFLVTVRGESGSTGQLVLEDAAAETSVSDALSISLSRETVSPHSVVNLVLNTSLSPNYYSNVSNASADFAISNAWFVQEENAPSISVIPGDIVDFYVWRKYLSYNRSTSSENFRMVVKVRWIGNQTYNGSLETRTQVSGNLSVYKNSGQQPVILYCEERNETTTDNSAYSIKNMSVSQYEYTLLQNASVGGFDCVVEATFDGTENRLMFSADIQYPSQANSSIIIDSSQNDFVSSGSLSRDLNTSVSFNDTLSVPLGNFSLGQSKAANVAVFANASSPQNFSISVNLSAARDLDAGTVTNSLNETRRIARYLDVDVDSFEKSRVWEVFPVFVKLKASPSLMRNLTMANVSLSLPQELAVLDAEPHPLAVDSVDGEVDESALSEFDEPGGGLFTLAVWREYLYRNQEVYQVRVHVLWDGDDMGLPGVSLENNFSYSGELSVSTASDSGKTAIYHCAPYFSETNASYSDEIPNYSLTSPWNKTVSELTHYSYSGYISGLDYDGFYCDVVGTKDANLTIVHVVDGEPFRYVIGNSSIPGLHSAINDTIALNYNASNKTTKSVAFLYPGEEETLRFNVLSKAEGAHFFNVSFEGFEEYANTSYQNNSTQLAVETSRDYSAQVAFSAMGESEQGTVVSFDADTKLSEENVVYTRPTRAWLSVSENLAYVESEGAPSFDSNASGDLYSLYVWRDYVRKTGEYYAVRLNVVLVGDDELGTAQTGFESHLSISGTTRIRDCHGIGFEEDDGLNVSGDSVAVNISTGDDYDGFACLIEGDSSSSFDLSFYSVYEGGVSFEAFFAGQNQTGLTNYSLLNQDVSYNYSATVVDELGILYAGEKKRSEWQLHSEDIGYSWVNFSSIGWDVGRERVQAETIATPVDVYGLVRVNVTRLPDRVYPDQVFNASLLVIVSENALTNVTNITINVSHSDNVVISHGLQQHDNESALLEKVGWGEDENMTYNGTNVSVSVWRQYTWIRGSRWKTRVFFDVAYPNESVRIGSEKTMVVRFSPGSSVRLVSCGLAANESKDSVNASVPSSVVFSSYQDQNVTYGDFDRFYCEVNSSDQRSFTLTLDLSNVSEKYHRLYDGGALIREAYGNTYSTSRAYNYSNVFENPFEISSMRPNESIPLYLHLLSVNDSDALVNITTEGLYAGTSEATYELEQVNVSVVFPFEVNVSLEEPLEIGGFSPLNVTVWVPNTSFAGTNNTSASLSLGSSLQAALADVPNATCSVEKILSPNPLNASGCVVVWREYEVKRGSRFRSKIRGLWKIRANNSSGNVTVLGNISVSPQAFATCRLVSKEYYDIVTANNTSYFEFSTNADNANVTEIVDGFECVVEKNADVYFNFSINATGNTLPIAPIKWVYLGSDEKKRNTDYANFSDKINYDYSENLSHYLGDFVINQSNKTVWDLYAVDDGRQTHQVKVRGIDDYTKMDYEKTVSFSPVVENFLKIYLNLSDRNLARVFPIPVEVKNSQNALTPLNDTTVNLQLPPGLTQADSYEPHSINATVSPLVAGFTVWREYVLLDAFSSKYRLMVHFDKLAHPFDVSSNMSVDFWLLTNNTTNVSILACYPEDVSTASEAKVYHQDEDFVNFSLATITGSSPSVNVTCVLEGDTDIGYRIYFDETDDYSYVVNFSLGENLLASGVKNFSYINDSIKYSEPQGNSFFVQSLSPGESAYYTWFAYSNFEGNYTVNVSGQGTETGTGFSSNTLANESFNVTRFVNASVSLPSAGSVVERGDYLEFKLQANYLDGMPYIAELIDLYVDDEYMVYDEENEQISFVVARVTDLFNESEYHNGTYYAQHYLPININHFEGYGVNHTDGYGNTLVFEEKYDFGDPWVYIRPSQELDVELIEIYYPSPAIKDTTIGFRFRVKTPLNETYLPTDNGRKSWSILTLRTPDGVEYVTADAMRMGDYSGYFQLPRDYPNESFDFDLHFADIFSNYNTNNVYEGGFSLYDKSATLKVWLYDNRSLEPVPGARVHLEGYGGDYAKTLVTDKKGFIGFLAGYDFLNGSSNYTVQVGALDYDGSKGTYALNSTGFSNDSFEDTIVVEIPFDAEVRIWVDPAFGSLHVLVVDETGAPVSGSRVFVYRQDKVVYEATTGENGAASFYPNYPGEYWAYALTQNYSSGAVLSYVSGTDILRIPVSGISPGNIVVTDLDGNVYNESNPLSAGKPYSLLVSLYGNYSGSMLPLNESVVLGISEVSGITLFSDSESGNFFMAETDEKGMTLVNLMPSINETMFGQIKENYVNISILSQPAGASFTQTSLLIPVGEPSEPTVNETIPVFTRLWQTERVSGQLEALINSLEWMSNCVVCG